MINDIIYKNKKMKVTSTPLLLLAILCITLLIQPTLSFDLPAVQLTSDTVVGNILSEQMVMLGSTVGLLMVIMVGL